MIYKLKKEMSNHNIGDILYLVDIKGDAFYEWLDDRDYILPLFEYIGILWNPLDSQ